MDARLTQPRTLKLAAVFLLLAVSVPSFLTMPFGLPAALDFQNLWAFHDCFARDTPYAASGAACGDVQHREMRYPPLLYWAFAWTRLLTFEAAGQLFMVVVAVGTLAAVAWWLWRGTGEPGADAADGLFAGLLMAQYPLLFAVERGNNDVVPLLLWTAAAHLYGGGRRGAAGVVGGLAAITKLYPAFACLVVAVGAAVQAVRRSGARRGFVAFALGGVVAVVAGFVVVWSDSVDYFTVHLPRIAALRPSPAPFAHPLQNLWAAGGGWVLGVPLLLSWCAASALTFERDPELSFAGGLAISTYFAGVSWDYNLITAYPLLVLLFRRMAAPGAGWLPFALLMIGLVGMVGHRGLVTTEAAAKAHIAIQWVFLVATAAAAPWLTPRSRVEGEAAPAAA